MNYLQHIIKALNLEGYTIKGVKGPLGNPLSEQDFNTILEDYLKNPHYPWLILSRNQLTGPLEYQPHPVDQIKPIYQFLSIPIQTSDYEEKFINIMP